MVLSLIANHPRLAMVLRTLSKHLRIQTEVYKTEDCPLVSIHTEARTPPPPIGGWGRVAVGSGMRKRARNCLRQFKNCTKPAKTVQCAQSGAHYAITRPCHWWGTAPDPKTQLLGGVLTNPQELWGWQNLTGRSDERRNDHTYCDSSCCRNCQ